MRHMHYPGMIAGILNKFGKIGVVIGFFLGNVLLTYVTNGNTAEIIHLKEIVIASIGLLLVPKNIEISISDLVGRTKFLPVSKERMLEENEDTVYKLNSVSETISESSKTYEEAAATMVEDEEIEQQTAKQKEEFIDYIRDKMAENEQNMLYEDIMDNGSGIAEDIYNCIKNKNEIFMQDIIDIFEQHNSYIVGLDNDDIKKTVEKDIIEVVKIANDAMKICKLNFVWSKKIEDDKKNISIGLDGVSKVISNVASSISRKNEQTFEKEKEEIQILLLQKNIGVYDIAISKQSSGKIIVDLYIQKNDNFTEEAKKSQVIEEILFKVFGENFVMTKQKKNIGGEENKALQTYISADKYKATVGITSRSKQGNTQNGDSTLKLVMEDGKILLAISDGMGSGEDASKSSNEAILMIRKLMGAGFEKEAAIELINNIINMKTKNETFATIDISILDLYNGNLELIKSGACPTYIKRGKDVEIIHAISLPAGILNNVDSVVFDSEIKKGDIIVMCSDGILDANREAINKEEAFKEFLKKMKTQTPQKIADLIISEAVDMGLGIARDDMSVIVTKIS